MNALDRHASRILDNIAPESRRAASTAPKQALASHFGLHVRAVPVLAERRGASGWCDGISFLDNGVVLYAPSAHSRRENFTLVHELAHKLVEDDTDALDWIADTGKPGQELERLCDRIAAELLLPDLLVEQVLDGHPPAAAHLGSLYAASAASEAVCAIALAGRLRSQGAVLIMDIGTQAITYASIASPLDDGWPLAYPWPRQEIPAHHRLLRLGPNNNAREKSWWQMPWGAKQPYYLDAVSGARRVHAVLSVYDLWEISRFHPDKSETAPERPTQHVDCICGYSGTVRGYPCDVCGQLYCPACKECDCPRRDAAQLICQSCWLAAPAADVVNGRCGVCRA